MNNDKDFKFQRGDLVYVVDFGQQYLMYYKAMGKLLSEAYNEPFFAYPICIGGLLKKRDWGEGEEVFKVAACGHCFGNSAKIYLLASEQELENYKNMSSEERNQYPFPVYVVGEKGLEEVKQKVFLVEFLPKTSRNDFFIVDVNCADGEYLLAGKEVKRGEVVEDFSGSNPKAHRLLVYVAAKDENEAQEKGTELFKEYLVDKVKRLSEERTEVEWMLGRLDERMEVDDE